MQDEEDTTEVRLAEVRLATDPQTIVCDVDWTKLRQPLRLWAKLLNGANTMNMRCEANWQSST